MKHRKTVQGELKRPNTNNTQSERHCDVFCSTVLKLFILINHQGTSALP